MENNIKKVSESADRNKAPLLEVLSKHIAKGSQILEVGSGSGQHAAYFSKKLPEVQWLSSDRQENHASINAYLKESDRAFSKPYAYEVGKDSFPTCDIEYVFTANTLHIMSWDIVLQFFRDLGEGLKKGCQLFVYGPFNYDGKYTSVGNEKFDSFLKEQNKDYGIRNIEDICYELKKYKIVLQKDIEMPANNRFLIFKKL